MGLVGESGSGKTTVTQAILGRVPISAGSIRFEGQEVGHLPLRKRSSLRRDIQMVFQNPMNSLNPSRSIWTSMREAVSGVGLSPQEALTRMVRSLERVGLDETALERFPAAFSGGQRQRICIARAIAPAPKLIICDEPVSALDLSVQRQVLDLLNELRAETGVSLLLISHDMDAVRYTTEHVTVILHGRVQETGPTRDVIDRPRAGYTRKLMQSTLIADPRGQRAKRTAAAQSAAGSMPDLATAGSASA